MPEDFDKEGLKNIIYIFGSEKGFLGSIDKFFFLNTAENGIYPVNFIRMSITYLNHIWVSCHRKKTWKVSSKTLFKSFWFSIYQLRLINFLGSG